MGTANSGTDGPTGPAAGALIKPGEAQLSRRAFFAGAASAVVLAIIPLPVDPVDRFIADLKAEGIWHKFDRIWILTTVDGQTFVNARGK